MLKGRKSFYNKQDGIFGRYNDNAQPFWNPEADKAFVEGLRSKLNPNTSIVELDANINDPAFSNKAVEMLLDMR